MSISNEVVSKFPARIGTSRFAPRPKSEPFFAGPVPWHWLSQAARLPGKSLHVAVVLWHLRNLKRSNPVRIERKWLRDMGVLRNSFYRGLRHLQLSGLVSVHCAQGRSKIVEIRSAPGRTRADETGSKKEASA